MAPLLDDSGGMTRYLAARRRQEQNTSGKRTGSFPQSTTPSSATKGESAASVNGPLSPADHLLSIMLTRTGPLGVYEVYSASFVTNEYSGREALRLLSQLPNTSLIRQQP